MRFSINKGLRLLIAKQLFLAEPLALHLGYVTVTKLKISVNIDARTLKFGMEHPWAQ